MSGYYAGRCYAKVMQIIVAYLAQADCRTVVGYLANGPPNEQGIEGLVLRGKILITGILN